MTFFRIGGIPADLGRILVGCFFCCILLFYKGGGSRSHKLPESCYKGRLGDKTDAFADALYGHPAVMRVIKQPTCRFLDTVAVYE